MKQAAVYMVTNKPHGVLYIGATSNLPQRAYQHKHKLIEGFTKKYNYELLVYFELHSTMENAITREKQLKSGSRANKIALIEAMNPEWNDLYDSLI